MTRRKKNPVVLEAKKKKAAPVKAVKQRSQPRPMTTMAPYATVGKDIGSLLGFPNMGERVGGAVGRLFGKGDYEVKTNSLISSYGGAPAGPMPPLTFRDGKRGTRFVEREFVGEVVSGALVGSSTAFTNQSYSINPGNPSLFPWLSTIARRFDQWEPHGIVLEFRSTSSEFNGTSQALGVVILATEYDAYDSAFSSKVEMENSDYAMSVKSSDMCIHGIECDPNERPTKILYCAKSNFIADGDVRLSNLGNFQIATQGMSVAGVTIGELWISYDITFYKKQIPQGDPTTDILLSAWQTNAGQSLAAISNCFGATGTVWTYTGNLPGFTFTQSTIKFPPTLASGRFLITFYIKPQDGSNPLLNGTPAYQAALSVNTTQLITGAFQAAYGLSFASTEGRVLENTPPSGGGFAVRFGQVAMNTIVQVTGAGATANFTGWTYSGSAITAMAVVIQQLPSINLPVLSNTFVTQA